MSEQTFSLASSWLLSGAAMLADHCPGADCLSPLFRFSDGSIKCPECQNQFRRQCRVAEDGSESSELVQVGRAPAPSATSAGERPTANVGMMNGHVDTPSSSNERSSLNGAVGSSHGNSVMSRDEYDQSRRRRNELSEQIGSFLLRNYTLLGDVCPNPRCVGVPLLRKPHPSREMYCCNCQSTVIHEADARPDQLPSQPADDRASARESSSEQRQSTATNVSRNTSMDNSVDNRTRRSDHAAPSSLTSPSEQETGGNIPINRKSLVTAVTVLESKLTGLSEQMAKCSLNELETIVRLATAMEKCAGALKACQK